MTLDQWARIITNVVLLIPAVMAPIYGFWLFVHRPQLYVLFGVLALLTFIPLLILRIIAVPDPPLMETDKLALVSLLVNALSSTFGMAWLVGLLRELYKTAKVQRKFWERGDSTE